jgi:hypothetical protein
MTAVFCDIYLFSILRLFKILGWGHLFLCRLGTGKNIGTIILAISMMDMLGQKEILHNNQIFIILYDKY